LLIVDEVQTGIYRTGEFLASNYYGIEPDIITLAKGLGGGVPIGVVMSKQKDILSTGEHGSTFGGNFLSTTAGLSVLKTLKKEYQSGQLNKRTSYFNAELEKFYKAHTNLFGKMVGIGMMRGLRLNDGVVLAEVIAVAHKHGVVVLKAGRNTLRFLPPLTITKKEIDQGFKRLTKAMKELG
jgi:acetylornithine/N-succinyldiaminopimelate aminotransferase